MDQSNPQPTSQNPSTEPPVSPPVGDQRSPSQAEPTTYGTYQIPQAPAQPPPEPNLPAEPTTGFPGLDQTIQEPTPELPATEPAVAQHPAQPIVEPLPAEPAVSQPQPATPPVPPVPDAPALSPDLPAIHPGQHYQLITPSRQADYYAALSSTQAPGFEHVTPESAPKPKISTPVQLKLPSFIQKRLDQAKIHWQKADKSELKAKSKPVIKSALIGLGIYAIFNSQIIFGQIQYLISPGNDSSSLPTSGEVVGEETEVIIPKINLRAPVVYDVTTFEEKAIQDALQRGVVHYGTTGVPGQLGNSVIVGHSSNNWWASGKYKFAFVLLSKLEVGDTFELTYSGQRYTYEITDKRIVEATDLSIINQDVSVPTATLVTCDPPGTSWKRLAIVGKQISPDPAKAQATHPEVPKNLETPLPGYGESLWEKVKGWFD